MCNTPGERRFVQKFGPYLSALCSKPFASSRHRRASWPLHIGRERAHSELCIHDDDADKGASAGRRCRNRSYPSEDVEHPEAGVGDRQEARGIEGHGIFAENDALVCGGSQDRKEEEEKEEENENEDEEIEGREERG